MALVAHRSGGLHLVRLPVIWGSSLSVVKIQQTIKTNIHTIYFLRAAALYKVMTDPSLKCLRDTRTTGVSYVPGELSCFRGQMKRDKVMLYRFRARGVTGN